MHIEILTMVKLLILLITILCLNQPYIASAKFGEGPPSKGKIRCCFEKGGGNLSGRCLEMSEEDCKLKHGYLKGKMKCCFDKKRSGFLSGRCLEMSEKDCKLKAGNSVMDCKECSGE
jgi:hypothetical protein